MKLNLGSGYRNQTGYINIDNRPECGPDLVADITEGLPMADNTVDEIRAFDILEHIPIGKTVPAIEEIWRVLKPGGAFCSMTPSTDGRGAFQDPTHVSFWNLNSFQYFMEPAYRRLYGIRAEFQGRVWDQMTDPKRNIIYTCGDLHAIK